MTTAIYSPKRAIVSDDLWLRENTLPVCDWKQELSRARIYHGLVDETIQDERSQRDRWKWAEFVHKQTSVGKLEMFLLMMDRNSPSYVRRRRARHSLLRGLSGAAVFPCLAELEKARFRIYDRASVDRLRSPISVKDIIDGVSSSTTSLSHRCDLILQAEVLEFSTSEVEQMLNLLHQFIDQNRFSNEEDVVIAVGAAIRKYAMNLPNDRMEDYAKLFDTSSTEAMSEQIELELVKAITWRLTAQPPEFDDPFPSLAVRLRDLADTYIRPRLITQKNFAAIAINALLGLLLLRHPDSHDLIGRLSALDIKWLSELMVRRIKALKNKIEANVNTASPEVFTEYLTDAEHKLVNP
jgi:hypothetical protein